MTVCSCVQCKKEYPVKGLHTHISRTHLGIKTYSSGNNGKYKQISENARLAKEERKELYYQNPKKCIECNSIIDFDNTENKFCSRSCSAKYTNKRKIRSVETNKKIAEALSGKKYLEYQDISITCGYCQQQFTKTIYGCSYKIPKYCCTDCRYKGSAIERNKHIDRTKLKHYRQLCQFKFGLSDYPEEFDFTLIEQYGWYKAANRGNNLNGISRDHIVSVKYGFINGIDPKIISHPANCRLVRHNDNVSKGEKSLLTIEELYDKIEEWNKKHFFKKKDK